MEGRNKIKGNNRKQLNEKLTNIYHKVIFTGIKFLNNMKENEYTL